MLSGSINSQLHKIDSQSILFTRKFKKQFASACQRQKKQNF